MFMNEIMNENEWWLKIMNDNEWNYEWKCLMNVHERSRKFTNVCKKPLWKTEVV